MPRVPYNQIAAIRTDYFEALRIFRPDRVEILRAYTPPDLLCCIRVRLHAPTYSVGKSKTVHPRKCRSLDFEIRVRKGYPALPPTVYFYGKRILASPNVNQMGLFARGKTGADNRLPTIVTEVLRAMLYADLHEAPEAEDSGRAEALSAWQQKMQRLGRFPTGEMEDYLRKPMPNAPSPLVLRRRPRKRLRR